MNLMQTIVVSGAGVLGLIFALRPLRTILLIKRVQKIRESALREAVSRGKASDEAFLAFMNATETMMGLIPMIASGLIGNVLNISVSPDDRNYTVVDYIDRNAWLAPFYSAARFSLVKSVSLGCPFSIKHWDRYYEAWWQLLTRSESDGGINMVPTDFAVREFQVMVHGAKEKATSSAPDSCNHVHA